MERRKHFFIFIGLLILTVVFGILSYCVLFDILTTEEVISTAIVIIWVFTICLTFGFAFAFPKKRRDIKPSIEEKPVPFEPMEDENVFTEVKEKQIVDSDVDALSMKKAVDSSNAELDELELGKPKIEAVSQDVSQQIEEKDIWKKMKDEPFKILVENVPRAIEIMKKIGLKVEVDADGLCWIEIKQVEKEREEDFITSIKSHIDDLNGEMALKEKIEHDKLDRTIDGITKKTEIKSNDVAQESQRQRVRKYLKDHRNATKEEIAEKFNITKDGAGQYIKRYEKSRAYLERERKSP